MTKYINESYILDALGVFSDRKNGNLHFLSGIMSAQEVIEEAPAEVTVIIGHCKDCIHYCQSECLKIYDDGACSEYARQTRKPYDFCSYFKPIPSPEH